MKDCEVEYQSVVKKLNNWYRYSTPNLSILTLGALHKLIRLHCYSTPNLSILLSGALHKLIRLQYPELVNSLIGCVTQICVVTVLELVNSLIGCVKQINTVKVPWIRWLDTLYNFVRLQYPILVNSLIEHVNNHIIEFKV